MILNRLHHERRNMRFNEILHSIPISSKTLSRKLKYLCKIGVLKRNILDSTPIIIEYSLTLMGQELNHLLNAMRQWSQKWTKEIVETQLDV